MIIMIAKQKVKAGKLFANMIAARDEAVLNAGGIRCESVLYNFAVDGAADHNFRRNLPAGAIVKRITVDVQTAVTGATDAVLKCGALPLISATDLTLLSGIASINTADLDGVKVVTEASLQLDFTAAPTAGKIRLFVEYLLPND